MMHMLRGMAGVVACAVLGACSPWPGLENSDRGFSGGTRVEDRSGNIGSQCGSGGVACNAGLGCLGAAPSGLCTKTCTSDADCMGASCQLALGGLYCLVTCASDQQCREQYACLSNGTVNVCAPDVSQPDATVPLLPEAGSGFEDGF